MANSSVCHSNNTNSIYRETHKERENERERQREGVQERGRRRTNGLLVGFWLIEYSLGGPRPGDRAPIPTIAGIGARWLVAVPRSPCPGCRAPVPMHRPSSRTPAVQSLRNRDTIRRLQCTAVLSSAPAAPCPEAAFLPVFNRVPAGVHRRSPGARPGHGRRRTATAVHGFPWAVASQGGRGHEH